MNILGFGSECMRRVYYERLRETFCETGVGIMTKCNRAVSRACPAENEMYKHGSAETGGGNLIGEVNRSCEWNECSCIIRCGRRDAFEI